jgi:hypothetical protein
LKPDADADPGETGPGFSRSLALLAWLLLKDLTDSLRGLLFSGQSCAKRIFPQIWLNYTLCLGPKRRIE